MPRIIDVHGHVFDREGLKTILRFSVEMVRYYQKKEVTAEELLAQAPTVESMAEDFRRHNMAGMPVAWDAETHLGGPKTSNDTIAAIVRKYPDVFLAGWGSVDPWKGRLALEEAERCMRELRLIGLKFQQPTQQFHVHDRRFYPLWDLCQDLGAVVQFHTGFSGLGTGMPGGGGVKLKYTRPIPDIDDVAADFPKLKIIALHAGDPWVEELNAVALHKANVYRETSGMYPRYFPEAMKYEMNRRLQNKYMFGSEYNLYPLAELVRQHEENGYRPGFLEKLFYKNAIRILGENLERVGVNLKEWE
jgi:predicted TIM-barrel fold metal-dependent hydrolase